MKAIYTAVLERLQTLVPELRFIDFDLGQLEQEKPPVSYPCALISITNGNYTPFTGTTQEGVLNIQVRLAFRTYERTSNVAQAAWRAVGLEHMDIFDKVRNALNNYSTADFDNLQYTNFQQEPRADLRVYRQLYTCTEYIDTNDPGNGGDEYIPFPGAPGALGFCVHEDLVN